MADTAHHQTVKKGRIYDDKPRWSRLRRWLRPFLGMWYVHPDVTLLVYASPAVCLGVLLQASKPSKDRLHLSDLFINGRRYHFVSGSADGFRMETTSKVPWRRKDRTRSTATLTGQFQMLDDNLTQINITARIRLMNMASRFFLPIFFTPLFLFAIWQSPLVRVIETLAIYILAWISYRYSAAMDAHDMVYFIEKVLEDFMPTSVTELGSHVPHVVDNREDFPEAWEKFYSEHADESKS